MQAKQQRRLELMIADLVRNLRIVVQQDTRTAVQALQERADEPLSVVPWGFRAFSQNDEDGIIAEIFRRIGTTNRVFAELGAGDGLENNTLFLLHQGWRGLWVDGSDAIDAAIAHYRPLCETGRLEICKRLVTPGNVDDLLAEHLREEEIDLLSVDIDGNDYHVLAAIHCVRPRVIVVEYNAKFPPPVMYCMAYDESHRWDGSDHFGASLKWLEVKLGERGYRLVGCNLTGSNAFFVRADLAGERFLAPYTADKHYQPARYELSASFGGLAGHPPSYRTLVDRLVEDDG